MNNHFPSELSGLLEAHAYAHPVKDIRLIETHISWVLLTGEVAYKIKRPVRYAFADLTSVERRAFFCAEEVRLNRRFSGDLYLSTCVITESGGQVRMGGEGRVIEHAVKMRQFDQEEQLDRLLARDAVQPEALERFGEELAVIHATLPCATQEQPWGQAATISRVILENASECIQAAEVFGGEPRSELPEEALRSRLAEARPWMEERFRGGRVRECHGDLHSRNVVRRDGRLMAFDCIEFEPAFRWIDVADEVAFLISDLDARGFQRHAHAFLSGYLTRSGDFNLCRFLRMYLAHRALVRAKIAALSAGELPEPADREPLRQQYARYVDCARRALQHTRPTLILMYGLSGSGKTWLAGRLAPELGAVLLRSDVERKRLAGLEPTARPASANNEATLGTGLYSRQTNEKVYEHLLQSTGDVLAGGYNAIVDATFSRAADRARFKELATQLSVNVKVVHCEAPVQVLRERISARQRAGNDASDADLAVLSWQQQHWQPLRADEGMTVVVADTTHPRVLTEVVQKLAIGA